MVYVPLCIYFQDRLRSLAASPGGMERLGAVVFAARPRMMGGFDGAGPFSGGGGTRAPLLIGGRPVKRYEGAWTVTIGPCRACFSSQGRAGHTLHGAAVVLFLINRMSCTADGGVEEKIKNRRPRQPG